MKHKIQNKQKQNPQADLPSPLSSPPLPTIANYYLTADKVEEYSNALSDVLCWLNGFVAGGGTYSPDTRSVLQDLNIGLKTINEQRITTKL